MTRTLHSILYRCHTLVLLMTLVCASASGQEAQWIWSDAHDKDDVPQVTCHFRKTIRLGAPDEGRITLLADDEYELFVNGRKIGQGGGTDELAEYDVSRFLSRGRNIVSIRVKNSRGSTAGVAARVLIRERGEDWTSYSTDDTWRANLRALALWNTNLYNDSRWPAAQVWGELGRTPPWDIREAVAEEESHASTERFKIARDFQVDELLSADATGSLLSMTFNEFGHILAGRSEGPLLLIYDSNDDGVPDKVKTYCDEVKNCQGILALNGDIFVTAQGPEGEALYRLTDRDRDGKLEEVNALIKFKGTSGEHSAHAIRLGPDGMLYVSVGNHAQPDGKIAETSPYQGYYEGDLLRRYEDPNGHADGVTAPGGVVLRTDLEGSKIELVAGGLRNAYDLAFNRQGELFVHDSDMESDIGTTWYRPTRLYHVTSGAEFGWRSGWAKWPNYFIDSLPEILDTGRGSPTGAVFYDHFAFPTRFHNQLFLADWSHGRILAVELTEDGASYSAKSEVFLEGQPLNVTDIEIGPDGALYFVTGGRGTAGGVYRVKWKGEIPEAVRDLGEGISAAIRQPQLHSAWARQKIAGVRKSVGEDWNRQILGVARSKANPWYYRTRAIDLMHLFGPTPTSKLLLRLSADSNEIVRAKAAEMMGLYPDEATQAQLTELLGDSNRTVRRKAFEALARSGQPAPFADLVNSLASDDRTEAWAARRLLEQLPLEQWREEVLTTDNQRLFIQGSLALLTAQPSNQNAHAVLDRFNALLDGFVTDGDFIDLLRLTQVALHVGEVTPGEIGTLRLKLGEEFPSGNNVMNRELARLLAYLQVSEPMDRYLAYLKSESDDVEKAHFAMHLRFIEEGWADGQRLELLDYLQTATKRKGGRSYEQYIQNAQRDVAKLMSAADGRAVLARAEEWPGAALGALYSLPRELEDETIQQLKRIDQRVKADRSPTAKSLRVGITAVLVRSDSVDAYSYLRTVWDSDPEHRETIAMGLAQSPEGENWEYLVKSLPVLEGEAAREVLRQLASVDAVPEESAPYRQVILLGLALKKDGGEAIDLLEHWSDEQLTGSEVDWNERITAWQDWYAEQFPDKPKAELPVASADSKWDYDELLAHITGVHGGEGSLSKGAEVFKTAQCIKCHRYGDNGEALGPDLTSISKRFSKKEVLQSILFPSHIISDQYVAKTIVLKDGKSYTGIVGAGAAGEKVVLQTNAQKVTVEEDDIEEIVTSKKSNMPDSLLDKLTLEQVSDLFAYLGMLPAQNVARARAGDPTN